MSVKMVKISQKPGVVWGHCQCMPHYLHVFECVVCAHLHTIFGEHKVFKNMVRYVCIYSKSFILGLKLG